MKSYKNVELFAKNAPSGSYAAGCPTHHRAGGYYTKYGYSERYVSESVVDDQGHGHSGNGMCSYCELFE